MSSVRFEPAIPTNERPQTHVQDRAATLTSVGRTSVNTLTNFRLPYNAINFLISWDTASFCRRTLSMDLVTEGGMYTYRG
jgi:hypothetical protein